MIYPFTSKGVKLLAVLVPVKAKNFRLDTVFGQVLFYDLNRGIFKVSSVVLPEDSYFTILGEITRDNKSGKTMITAQLGCTYYNIMFDLENQTGLYFKNPMPEPDHFNYKFNNEFDEWIFKSESYKNKYGDDFDKWVEYKEKLIPKDKKVIILKQD